MTEISVLFIHATLKTQENSDQLNGNSQGAVLS